MKIQGAIQNDDFRQRLWYLSTCQEFRKHGFADGGGLSVA
jgi:hypothetical protein